MTKSTNLINIIKLRDRCHLLVPKCLLRILNGGKQISILALKIFIPNHRCKHNFLIVLKTFILLLRYRHRLRKNIRIGIMRKHRMLVHRHQLVIHHQLIFFILLPRACPLRRPSLLSCSSSFDPIGGIHRVSPFSTSRSS